MQHCPHCHHIVINILISFQHIQYYRMLVKRIISITSVYFRNTNPTLQPIINNKSMLLSCHAPITTSKTPQYSTYQPLSKSMIQFYEFCTNIELNGRNTSKRVLADNFGFSLNVEQFKNVNLTDKISILLRILKKGQEQSMDIVQKNKISQIKQLFIEQINRLELSQQIKYYSYFVSGFKLWLYENLSVPIKDKQEKVADFRAKLPKIDDYFRNLKIDQDDNMTMQEINNLLINFQCVPQSQHYSLLTAAVPHLDKTNHQVLALFLADACYSSSIPKSFFDKLYGQTNIQELRWPYIFYLYKFAEKYKQFYSPLLNLHKMSKNSRQPYYKHQLYKDIDYAIQTLKITDKLINQSQLKQFVYDTSYHLGLFDRLVSEKKLETIRIVGLYNKFSQIMPIGNRNYREISANKDSLVRELSPEILEFIKLQLKSIEPKYIYSISEKCVGEISLPILFLLQFFLKKILTTDIYFVLELSAFYPLVGEKIRSSIIMNTTLILRKIMANFLELSQEQRRTPQNIALLKKIIYFIYSTRNNISKVFSQSQDFRDYVIDYTLGLNKADRLEELKLIYYVVSLVEKENFYRFSEICGIFIKYIEDAMKEERPIFAINQTKQHEEYILRIISLLIDHSPKINTQATKALLTDFINTKFIYQIKSVKKQGVFDLFNLIEKLKNINCDVYGILLNNLSTFVIFTQNNKKFHLPRGPKSIYKEQFVLILKKAIAKYQLLKEIKQKDHLNILITLAIRFWNELHQKEIAKLLIIFGSPTFLNDKMKNKVKNINFSPQTLEGIPQIDALKAFKYCNTNLFNILNQENHEKSSEKNFQIQDFDLTELNIKTVEQIAQIFINFQFYQEVLEDPKIMCQSYIPEPPTKDININSIYACLKIFDKIRNSYNFKLSINALNQENDEVVDISDEIRYIKQNNLIRMDDLNEFKLGNYEVECNHTMIEGWYSYDSYDNLLEIQNFSNVGQTIDNPYEKVLLSLFGDIGYIRQYTKKQTFFSDPVFAALNLGLQAEPQGSLIEITKPDPSKPETIYILCSNDSSYKISSIFAYVFKKVGLQAYIVTSMNTRDEISEFLKKKFNLNQEEIERLKYTSYSDIDSPQEDGKVKKGSSKKQNIGKIEILSDKSLNMSD